MVDAFAARFGVYGFGEDGYKFVADLINWMAGHAPRFEQVFFDWFGGAASDGRFENSPIAQVYGTEEFLPLKEILSNAAPIRETKNTFFDGPPETMLIDEVEEIWSAIDKDDDWTPLEKKIDRIRAMGVAYGFRSPDDVSS